MSDSVMGEIEAWAAHPGCGSGPRLNGCADPRHELARIAREQHEWAVEWKRAYDAEKQRAEKAEAERDEAIAIEKRTHSIHAERGEESCHARRIADSKEIARMREALTEIKQGKLLDRADCARIADAALRGEGKG